MSFGVKVLHVLTCVSCTPMASLALPVQRRIASCSRSSGISGPGVTAAYSGLSLIRSYCGFLRGNRSVNRVGGMLGKMVGWFLSPLLSSVLGLLYMCLDSPELHPRSHLFKLIVVAHYASGVDDHQPRPRDTARPCLHLIHRELISLHADWFSYRVFYQN